MRNRIGDRSDSFEPKVSFLIAVHDCSTIRTLSIRVLYVVKTRAISLPDVNLDIRNRLSYGVFDSTNDQAGLAISILGDSITDGHSLGFVCMKWAKYSALGTVLRLWMVYCVY